MVEHTRERLSKPRVNFNEHPNRGRTYGSTRERVNSSSKATVNNRPIGATNIRAGYTGNRPISNEPLMRDANSTGRTDSTN